MMNKNLLIFAMIVLLTFFSCSGKNRSEATGLQSTDSASAAAPNAAVPAPVSKNTRNMVKNANLRVQVENIQKAASESVKIVEKAGGYVLESNFYGNNTAYMRFGVPSDILEATLSSLSETGIETKRSISTEDVTDQMIDLEAELANKKLLRERLRALLSRAKDVKDVLAVETELTRIQTEIDATEGRLKQLKQNVSYAKVYLELTPKAPEKKQEILGPLGYLYYGVKWFVIKLFVIQPVE